jgi:hypothetical protein
MIQRGNGDCSYQVKAASIARPARFESKPSRRFPLAD